MRRGKETKTPGEVAFQTRSRSNDLFAYLLDVSSAVLLPAIGLPSAMRL